MTTCFIPLNLDLHNISKIIIKTSNHNGSNQQDPDDDFFVTKISLVRADGVIPFTVSSYSNRNIPIAVEFREPAEYRNRMLKPGEQAPEEPETKASWPD